MPYDANQDRFSGSGAIALGSSGVEITPDDDNDITPYPRAICVIAEGDLAIIPVMNPGETAGDIITIVGAPVGFIPPWRVRRVMETTTATVATVEGI